jgi:hypothetical protein
MFCRHRGNQVNRQTLLPHFRRININCHFSIAVLVIILFVSTWVHFTHSAKIHEREHRRKRLVATATTSLGTEKFVYLFEIKKQGGKQKI